jgi:hypothetical protein
MSTRTIIEINHDYISSVRTLADMHDLLQRLPSSEVTGQLNRNEGKPVIWNGNPAIRILGQRHHSEPEWLQPCSPTREELASLLAALHFGQYNTNDDEKQLRSAIRRALKNFDIGTAKFV